MRSRDAPRVFKTKAFARFADAEGIADAALCEAIARALAGRFDADLGGGVVKQRIARAGAGRSGGYRAVVLFRRGAHAFFVFGFAKSSRATIRPDELRAFRRLAVSMLAFDVAALAAVTANGTLKEIRCDGEAISE